MLVSLFPHFLWLWSSAVPLQRQVSIIEQALPTHHLIPWVGGGGGGEGEEWAMHAATACILSLWMKNLWKTCARAFIPNLCFLFSSERFVHGCLSKKSCFLEWNICERIVQEHLPGIWSSCFWVKGLCKNIIQNACFWVVGFKWFVQIRLKRFQCCRNERLAVLQNLWMLHACMAFWSRVSSLKTLSDASVNSAQDKDEISKICCMPVRVSKCVGRWIYVMHICVCVCVYAFFHWSEQEKTKIWNIHTILLIKLLFNHQQNIKEWNVFSNKMNRQHLFIYLAYNEYMQVLTNIHGKQWTHVVQYLYIQKLGAKLSQIRASIKTKHNIICV